MTRCRSAGDFWEVKLSRPSIAELADLSKVILGRPGTIQLAWVDVALNVLASLSWFYNVVENKAAYH